MKIKVRRKVEIGVVTIAFIILFIVLYKTFGFFYGINDDISMQRLAAGSTTTNPDGHLIFIKYGLGVLLSSMFKLIPQIDWYGLFLIGCVFTCGYIIILRSFALTAQSYGKFLIRSMACILVIFMIIDTTIMFQFTVVAGILAATAVFYMISSGKLKISEYIIAWILMLIASLIRVKVFYMTLPIAGIITIGKTINYIFYNDQIEQESNSLKMFAEKVKKSKFFLCRIFVISILGFLLFESINLTESIAYSKSPWSNYMEYKHARSMIMDYYNWPDYSDNEDFWSSVGISEEEYDCLKLYGVLPNIDADTIIDIANYAKSNYYVPTRQHIANMKNVLMAAIKSENCRWANILLALSIIIYFIIFIKAKPITKWGMLLGGLAEILILIYLLYGGRFPSRIILTYDYQCILAIWGLLFANADNKLNRWIYVSSLLLMVCILFSSVKVTQIKTDKQKTMVDNYLKYMDFFKSNPDTFYIVPTGTLTTSKRFTLREQNLNAPNMSGTYGWSIFSPWSDKKFSEYGLLDVDHIILQPNVCMFTTDVTFADKLSRYYYSEGWIDKDYEIIDRRFVAQDCEVFIIKWEPAAAE